MLGTALANYCKKIGYRIGQYVRLGHDSPTILVMTWSNLIGLHFWLQQYVQLVYKHDTRPFLPLVKELVRQTSTIQAGVTNGELQHATSKECVLQLEYL